MLESVWVQLVVLRIKLVIELRQNPGFEVAVRVKRLGSRVRLVALSGYGDAASREHAREVGFDAYLVKPVAPEDVARVLSGL